MKQQQGFTLIELIIVIVILGILAVTAAPRFIDIQSDARSEVVQGVKGALQGASQLIYAKAAIAGVQKSDDSTVTIGTDTVETKFGYPDAAQITTAAAVGVFLDVELDANADFEFIADDANNSFKISYRSITPVTGASPTGCYVEYTSAAAIGATPTYTAVVNNC